MATKGYHHPRGIEEALLKAFGNEVNYNEISYGWQARFQGTIFTFYTGKKNKVHITPDKWSFYTWGKEVDFIKQWFVDKEAAKLTKQQARQAAIENEDKGTQACIDHVEKKIALMQQVEIKTHTHNAIVSMLRTLKSEFNQFL